MARSSKLRVMISSRCNDSFPANSKGRPLSEIRKALKAEVEALEVFGKPIVEVWINEDAPPQGGTWDSWDVCIQAVKDCDVLIALSNGNAGWAQSGGDIGICHAELMTGLSRAPAKVRLIALENVKIAKTPKGDRNRRFQEYVDQAEPISWRHCFDGNATKGARERGDSRRLDRFGAGRRSRIEQRPLPQRRGARLEPPPLQRTPNRDAPRAARRHAPTRRFERGRRTPACSIGRRGCAVCSDRYPGGPDRQRGQGDGWPAVSPRSRALVGPQQKKGTRGGPVHVIACHKTATEAQAIRLLGFPDATVVSAPFGVFVADRRSEGAVRLHRELPRRKHDSTRRAAIL